MTLQNELETNHSFSEIIGKNQKMQHLFTQIQTVAAGDITVLIQGETGTGKELIAKAIHDNSPRNTEPFVAINCAAIPEGLIESELFGNERGAFTGAIEPRIGKFEQANRGTLFLDEIGDMPLALQTRLLRVLQEREFQRLGGTNTISIDIRVLAATNQDLEDAIRKRYFREDLYHRLAAFPITVPPLRERREDIPILADHFLKKYAAAAEKPIRDISTDALQMLMQHDFSVTCANWKTPLRGQFYMRQQTSCNPKASFYIRRKRVHNRLQATRRIPPLFFRLTKLNEEPSSTPSK